MPYQVLARKYRPLRFSDVVGQDHVTRTLQNALEQGRVAHGYIFSGHRGIGKTTIARILASALNCRNPIGSDLRPTPEPCLQCDSCLEIRSGNAVDVIEIDAATNRGIDEIRELRDAARYSPARDKFKIYILDEAHQITDAAFNALLKTLEEPPAHIIFMMATTEPENIPQTIRSRCQHFSFHAVKLDDILGQLRKISVDENVLADSAALDLLAEAGDGSMRDALSIMDQAIASAPTVDGKPQLSAAEIRDLMGAVPNTIFEEILEYVSDNQAAGVLTTASRLLDAGNSPAQIARQFVRYLRNCVVAKIANLTPESPDTELLQISPDERRRAARSAALFTEEELTRFLQVMLRTFDDLGFRQEQRFHLELGLLKLVHLQRLLPMEQFLSQLPRPAGSPPPSQPAPARPQSRPVQATAATPSRPSAAVTSAPGPSPAQSVNPFAAPTASGSATPAPPASASPVSAPPGSRSSSSAESTAPASLPPAQSAPSTIPPSAFPERTVAALPAVHRETPQAAAFVNPFGAPESKPSSSVTASAPQTSGSLAIAIEAPFPVRAVPSQPEATPVHHLSPFAEPGVQIPPNASTGINTHLPGAVPPLDIEAVVAAGPAPAAGPPPEADPEATEPASEPTPNTEAAELQAAAVEALFAAKTHNSAAEQLEETTWEIAEGEIRIQTSLSKQLMGTIFRPDVEAILKTALRNKGVTGLRIVFLPGNLANKAKSAPKKPRTGSAQAKAMEHPTVQAAQKLFNAEVTNVFDLRRD